MPSGGSGTRRGIRRPPFPSLRRGVRSRCGCVPSTGQSPSTPSASIRASSGRGRGVWGTSRSDATPRRGAAESPPAPAGRESDSRTPPPCPGLLFQSNGSTAARSLLRGSSSVRSFPVAGFPFLFPLPFDFSFPLVGERMAGDGRSSSASRTWPQIRPVRAFPPSGDSMLAWRRETPQEAQKRAGRRTGANSSPAGRLFP